MRMALGTSYSPRPISSTEPSLACATASASDVYVRDVAAPLPPPGGPRTTMHPWGVASARRSCANGKGQLPPEWQLRVALPRVALPAARAGAVPGGASSPAGVIDGTKQTPAGASSSDAAGASAGAVPGSTGANGSISRAAAWLASLRRFCFCSSSVEAPRAASAVKGSNGRRRRNKPAGVPSVGSASRPANASPPPSPALSPAPAPSPRALSRAQSRASSGFFFAHAASQSHAALAPASVVLITIGSQCATTAACPAAPSPRNRNSGGAGALCSQREHVGTWTTHVACGVIASLSSACSSGRSTACEPKAAAPADGASRRASSALTKPASELAPR